MQTRAPALGYGGDAASKLDLDAEFGAEGDEDEEDEDEGMEGAAASGKPKGMMSAFRGLVSTRSLWRAPPALAPLRLTGRAHRADWAGRPPLSGCSCATRP